MSRFEFNTVLVSIVLAFAISEILTAWGRLIRNRARVRSAGLFVLASFWVLLMIVAHWFGLWAYHDAPFDHFAQTILVLLPSLVIALVCFIWVPDIPAQGDFDVERHYFESARWTLVLISLFILLGGAADQLVPHVEFGAPLWFLIPWAATLLGSAFSGSRTHHLALYGGSLLVIAMSMGLGGY